jgi:4-diphosphocytidyl-2-C-methyl-D-erythritol kinase
MLRISAPAKLNLFLHITGRRDDHYHLLESLFVFTKLGDEIQIEPANTLSLNIVGPYSTQLKNEPVENNLAFRAGLLLKSKYAIQNGAAITLTKNIPIGAGLGGGSSDAAAVLNGLNQLWHLNLSHETLSDMALSLGADVPACLLAKPTFVSGIGETMDDFSLPFSIPVLLVNPNIRLSTPSVFQAYQNADLPFSPSIKSRSISAHNWSTFLSMLKNNRNDLEQSAIELEPSIAVILNCLNQQPQCALARMSGSGSTCFALFSDPASAKAAMLTLQSRYPNFWIKNTQIECSTWNIAKKH